jgi:hypothetical protein
MKIETFTNTLLTGEMREDMIIYDDNGGYVSMPKAVYEAQQAEQSTPIVRDDE